jgi:AcrR family transcriptional regulator
MQGMQTGLRERKRRQTRRTIERVALELFARQGFQATTIPQIAEAADVSPRTVSAYFPRKEDLAFPDPEEEFRSLETRLRDRRPGETAARALGDWIRSLLEEEGERAAERQLRRRVIRADEALSAYEHRYTMRAQGLIASAIADDLGLSPDALEPRMAAAATVTVLEVLGDDFNAVMPSAGAEDDALRAEALARVERALVFIAGGIRALQDEQARR